MALGAGTYEVKGDRLVVNGEPVGIDRRVVREMVRRYQEETGREAGFLPLSVVDRILAVDRAIALARLKAELHEACA